MERLRWVELIGLPVLWCGSIYAALSVRDVAIASSHSICGPWGCGPTTGALMAVHLGWAAIIWPPLAYFPYRFRWRSSRTRSLGITLATCGAIGAVGIVAWQWLVWLPQANEWSKPYIWQRSGFALVTAVDWPLFQLIGIGTFLSTRRRPIRD